MQIGTLANEASVGVETIRFYERKGLIARPLRPRDGGFRSYPPETADRIRFIRHAQELGFTLKEVGELLSLSADPDTNCANVREHAQAKLQDVNLKIESLISIRSALEALVAACPGKGKALRVCSILNALAVPGSDPPADPPKLETRR